MARPPMSAMDEAGGLGDFNMIRLARHGIEFENQSGRAVETNNCFEHTPRVARAALKPLHRGVSK